MALYSEVVEGRGMEMECTTGRYRPQQTRAEAKTKPLLPSLQSPRAKYHSLTRLFFCEISQCWADLS